MFLSFDLPDILIQLINFGIFYAVLHLVFLRHVGKAIAERRKYIDSLTTEYGKYQMQASQGRAQADQIRAAARREAETAIAKARADASNKAAEISAQFNAQAAQEVERAHAEVDAELKAARANEAQTVRELAELVLSRTLKEVER